LGSYRIAEYETGQLWWETHVDFGMHRSGECLNLGNMLIIKPWSIEKSGSLIGEFLDQLKKLPPWDRTAYWCFSADLLDVITGKKLKDEVLRHMVSRFGLFKTTRKEGVQGTFKLHGRCITRLDDGSIFWQATGGHQRIVSGKGLIESDILFLGPPTGDEIKQSRQEFLEQLSQLPPWDQTSAWCCRLPLNDCQAKQKPVNSFSKERSAPRPKSKIVSAENSVAADPDRIWHSNKKTENPQDVSIKSIGHPFTRLRGVNFFKPQVKRKLYWLTALLIVLTGLIIWVSVSHHFLKNRIHWFHWHEDHHHSRLGSVLGIILLILFLAGGSTALGAEEKDMVLEDSGIHYPGGFDPNTVGEIQGKASHFWKPEKGPIRFKLVTRFESYIILTSPPWYWNHLPVRIPEGAEVAVRGSKSVGRDGKLYIIASEIQLLPSGKILFFRGSDGCPLWKTSPGQGRESTGNLEPSTSGVGSGSSYQNRGRH
jgi:hypothetical protein